MFGISGEHLLVLGVILLIFGPRRLPELGNTLGKAIKNFKDSISGIEEAQFRRIDGNKSNSKTESPQSADPTVAQTPTPETEPKVHSENNV